MDDPTITSHSYYHPPWYPNQDPLHNPWTIVSQTTRKTRYAVWCDSLPKGELLRLVREHQAKRQDSNTHKES